MAGQGDSAPATPVGLREFGRLVGVSGEAVRKAIETGRIPADLVGSRAAGSKVWPTIIDPAAAVAAWRSNTDETQQRDTRAQAAGAKRARAERGEGKAPATAAPAPAPARSPLVHRAPPPSIPGTGDDEDGPDDLGPDGLPSVASSKRRQEVFKTRKLEREDAIDVGRLVDAEAMRTAFREQVVGARNALLGVPTKAKARIPTLTLRDIEILEDLITDALKDVAAAAAGLAKDPPA